jgi:hypothetical protein
MLLLDTSVTSRKARILLLMYYSSHMLSLLLHGVQMDLVSGDEAGEGVTMHSQPARMVSRFYYDLIQCYTI